MHFERRHHCFTSYLALHIYKVTNNINRGTTQLPIKRNRRTDSDGKAKLSITTSRTDRRVVSKPESGKAQDKDKKVG